MFNFKSEDSLKPKLSVSKNNRAHLVILLAGAATLIILSGLVGYYFGQSNGGEDEREFSSVNNNAGQDTAYQCAVGEVFKNGACVPGPTTTPTVVGEDNIRVTSTVKAQYENLPAGILQSVVWKWPELTEKKGYYLNSADEKMSEYYSIGDFSYNNKNGEVIFLVGVSYDMGAQQRMIMIDFNNKVYVLAKESHEIGEPEMYAPNYAKFVIDKNLDIPEWDFPLTFTYGQAKFELTGHFGDMFGGVDPYPVTGLKELLNGYEKSFVISKWGNVYLSDDGSHHLIAPDGTVANYVIDVPFIDANGVAAITWNDGDTTKYSFIFNQDSGCGGYGTVAVNKELTSQDLVEVGRASNGDKIYAIKDTNSAYLKKEYDSSYYPSEGENISFEEYLKSKPLVFWYDALGRLVRLKNLKFKLPVECGKPVIYLYPEEETEVNVELDLMKLTYSDPLYKNGWKVVAKPNGELKEVGSGKYYPYLFWEGIGGGRYLMGDKGFVVEKAEVKKFLDTKLAVLGLNKKESVDFIEFWQPLMQKSPYYLVKFMGTGAMNELAPLSIDPKPDTMIRIFMEFQELEKPVQIEAPVLRTPARKGFTVVEWGGLLR